MIIKIQIICLGKFKEKAFLELEREYLKRLGPYAKMKILEIPEIAYKSSAEIEIVKKKEAAVIRKALPKDAVVILLEEKGVVRDSLDFAEFIGRIGGFGREMVFVIGSGVGLDSSLKDIANHTISLSKLTFTHNFARVLLEEQLYRAVCILHGKEYHK